MTAAAKALAQLATPRIDTRAAARRDLSVGTLDDLCREVDRIEGASRPENDGIRVTGNWSAGQIFEHLARGIERSLDGFAAPPGSERPLPGGLRSITGRADLAAAASAERSLKARLLTAPMLPDGPSCAMTGELEPPAQTWTVDGANRLRSVVQRLRSGHPMNKPSPTMGRLTPDEWLLFHLRHAALHLSFIVIGERR